VGSGTGKKKEEVGKVRGKEGRKEREEKERREAMRGKERC